MIQERRSFRAGQKQDDADNLITKTEPFADDFDDDNYSGWSASGTLAVSSNKLVVTGGSSSASYAYKTNTAEDGEIVFRYYRPSASTGWSIVYLRHDLFAKWLRILSNGSQMVLQELDGTTTNLDTNYSAGMSANTWYTIRVRMKGTDVTVDRAASGEGLEEVLSTTGADDTLATGRVYFGSDANQVYYYDDIQLMLGGASTSTMFAYNAVNELTTMTKCNVASTYTYDSWGRTISLARDGQGASYTYAYGDKLTSVDADWEVTVDYSYNGLGQRVSRSHEDITTNYYWNGWSVVNEYFDDDSDNDIHTWDKTYVGGLAERAYSGGAYTYYFTDHLGSTEALYDESKDCVGGIGYTPYGTPAFAEGDADGVTRRYTGHDWDALTGQYFAPYRYYSPTMSRWLTRDPLGMVDGPNVYGYVGGRPTNEYDEIGLKTYEDCEREYEICNDKVRKMPNKTIAQKARRGAAWEACTFAYGICRTEVAIEQATEKACEYAEEHPVACAAIGTVVVIAGVTYIVGTGGLGTCTLIPVLAI